MSGALVVVTGTGTGVGKTHFSEALVRALASLGRQIAGLKPIETGIGAGETDGDRLARSSTFHVKPFGHAFGDGVSPHLAARRAREPIRVDAVLSGIQRARRAGDVLVELAGGLFSPLSDQLTNADLVRQLEADYTLLVAPDRLGVLHDVIATLGAARKASVRLSGLVVVAPEHADASTGTNAEELGRLTQLPVMAEIPRAPVTALATTPAIAQLARRIAAVATA